MRNEITFQPAKHPAWSGTLPKISGYETKFGCVLHRSISPYREALGYWDVTDLTTGAQVVNGEYPGIEGAVAALVLKAQAWRSYPGGFAGALDAARQRAILPFRFSLSAFPHGEQIIINAEHIVELLAGLNATMVRMQDGSEHLVNEAAEVIRYQILECTGFAVPIV